MKIARKVVFALFFVLLSALALRTWLVIDRALTLLNADAREDQTIVFRAIRPAFVETWIRRGEQEARALIESTDQRMARVELRFHPLNALPLDESQKLRLQSGVEVHIISGLEHGARKMSTYAPIFVAAELVGAIEVSESLAAHAALAREQIFEALLTAVLLAVVALLLAGVVGLVMIGRPVDALVREVRRMASGDLSRPIQAHADDELGALATEMEKMRSRLAEVLEQLRHAERLITVGKLASAVAHELGTPLTIIAGRAGMIECDRAVIAPAAEAARAIREQVARMTKMIRSMLDFARRRRLEKRRVDLREVALSTVQMLEPLTKTTHRVVQLRCDDAPLYADVDADMIEQALMNLITNAIDATSGPDPVLVSVMRQGDREARMSVTDHGSGIPEELLPHVFEPFFTTKNPGRGTGLGLSIASGIAADHGGRIEVETKRSHGSCFALILPTQSSSANGPASPL